MAKLEFWIWSLDLGFVFPTFLLICFPFCFFLFYFSFPLFWLLTPEIESLDDDTLFLCLPIVICAYLRSQRLISVLID